MCPDGSCDAGGGLGAEECTDDSDCSGGQVCCALIPFFRPHVRTRRCAAVAVVDPVEDWAGVKPLPIVHLVKFAAPFSDSLPTANRRMKPVLVNPWSRVAEMLPECDAGLDCCDAYGDGQPFCAPKTWVEKSPHR